MANENVVMNNGDLTAVGRVTAAKIKAPTAADFEIGSSDTLEAKLNEKITSPSITGIESPTYLKRSTSGTLSWSDDPLSKTALAASSWSSYNHYDVKDYVSYEGRIYVCIASVFSMTSPDNDPTHWMVATYANVHGVDENGVPKDPNLSSLLSGKLDNSHDIYSIGWENSTLNVTGGAVNLNVGNDITAGGSLYFTRDGEVVNVTTAIDEKVGSFAIVGGVLPTVSGGVADLSTLFTGANTSNNLDNIRTSASVATNATTYIGNAIADACPYGVNVLTVPSDLQLVDGCVNTINLNAANVQLVLPTMPIGKQADLLIEITVAAGATVSGFSIVAPTGATMERIRMTDDVTLEAPASGMTIYQYMYTSRRTDDGAGTPAYRVYSAQKKGEVVA